MGSEVFKRLEKKFLINSDQMEEILNFFGNKLVADKHSINGYYPVYSIYYDTPNNDVIRHSTSHPVFKEKLRIRSYKIDLTKEDNVFVELKRKYDGLGNKRRIVLPYLKYQDFIKGSYFPYKENDPEYVTAKEIQNHLSVYKDSPKIFIKSSRRAYFGADDDNFRITFDTSVKYRYNNLDFKEGKNDREFLKNGAVIMEVKFLGALPLEFAQKLSQLKVYPRGYSKYGKIFISEIGEKKYE